MQVGFISSTANAAEHGQLCIEVVNRLLVGHEKKITKESLCYNFQDFYQ